MRRFASLALATILAGCASPSATPAATPSASASATAVALAGLVFDVPDFSGKATIRIREQLFDWPAPDDAVLTTDGISGAFGLRDDGTFAEGSLLRVPLITLKSDDDRRADAARETRWDVRAQRQGRDLSVVARPAFKFGHLGRAPPRRGPVLSIVDEIRMEI